MLLEWKQYTSNARNDVRHEISMSPSLVHIFSASHGLFDNYAISKQRKNTFPFLHARCWIGTARNVLGRFTTFCAFRFLVSCADVPMCRLYMATGSLMSATLTVFGVYAFTQRSQWNWLISWNSYTFVKCDYYTHCFSFTTPFFFINFTSFYYFKKLRAKNRAKHTDDFSHI